jgi:hypothetical protein
LDGSGFNVGVRVLNGLTLNGTVLLGNPIFFSYGRMLFEGTQTLSGNGSVILGRPDNGSIVGVSGGTLTIGSGITIHGAGGQMLCVEVTDTILNNSTISADVQE